jgi:hypothetical protein
MESAAMQGERKGGWRRSKVRIENRGADEIFAVEKAGLRPDVGEVLENGLAILGFGRDSNQCL